jgi:hypothetical protein
VVEGHGEQGGPVADGFPASADPGLNVVHDSEQAPVAAVRLDRHHERHRVGAGARRRENLDRRELADRDLAAGGGARIVPQIQADPVQGHLIRRLAGP